MTTLTSTTEAAIGLNKCKEKCEVTLSVEVGKCIKKHPITESDGRLKCNRSATDKELECSNRCQEKATKCYQKCWMKAMVNWEPCVVKYNDPNDPKRIKCIKDVNNALDKCGVPCIH
ncbi:hypothetical protein BGW41_006719 [Actinomortierella wolfii]|nr:hypothetical protein BGW41_006719 [Actinomortierella wolfii]